MSSALDAEGGLAGLEPGTTVGIEHLQLSTGGPFHNRSFRELARVNSKGALPIAGRPTSLTTDFLHEVLEARRRSKALLRLC